LQTLEDTWSVVARPKGGGKKKTQTLLSLSYYEMEKLAKVYSLDSENSPGEHRGFRLCL